MNPENFADQPSKDDELSIVFSDTMDWQSMPTNSEDVVVYPVNGGHRTGSSQIKVKNIVDSAWEKSFHWGNLVANHFKGQYFAYALTVPGKSGGMVRVIRSGSSDRILLKGFRGFVRDLSFAFHETRILLAAVDEYGYLLVHEINGANSNLVLQVNPDGISTSSDNHRVVWCPYVPDDIITDENGKEIRGDAADHALMLAVSHNCNVEVWHLGHVNGTVTYASVSVGAMVISVFEEDVVDIAFSPDSTAVAVASLDGYVRFFLVNTLKQPPKMLHKWQPHEKKKLSGICFLDNLTHPNIREAPLWKWAITSAENNTEFKLWSCEQWNCHQTIRFKSPDSAPIIQKMVLDLSASFLVVSDFNRKVLYVMHIEQEAQAPSKVGENGVDSQEDRIVSRVTSITQLLLSFSAISLAIREAKMNLKNVDEDFEGDEKSNRVSLKMLVVQPKSLQKCKAVFELGTSVPLGEGFDPSYSTINTTSEYESTTAKASTAGNYYSLLTPDAFVSPAKSNDNANNIESSATATPGSMPLPPVTPNEMLALSSPRRPSPETVTSSTMPCSKRNGSHGIQSGASSPSREVEEILATRPMTEGSGASPDTSSNVATASGSVLQDALAAYPPSLSPAFIRASSASSKEALSPTVDKFKTKCAEEPLCTYPTSSASASTGGTSAPVAPPSAPADLNGSLMELFKEVLVKPAESSPMPTSTQTWPTVLPTYNPQQPQQLAFAPKEEQEETESSYGQLQTINETLNHLVQLVSTQQAEQQQLKSEIAQLRSELASAETSRLVDQPTWIPQLESTFAIYFEKQLKKMDEINSPQKTQQTVNKLQSAIRSEFENKAHTLEQRSVDFIRKELQSVIAGEMAKMEPILRNSSMQLLTQISQNKSLIDAYSTAMSGAAVTAMNRACKDTISQNLMPSLERSFQNLFNQLHDTFSKGIAEFVRNIETNLDRQRRLQDKETTSQLNASMEKMRLVLDQARDSITNETKAELRKISTEFPEKVRGLLTPIIHGEMQAVVKNQKAALDGALLAVQQAAQVQSRASTPAVPPAVITPAVLQAQLKQLVQEGRWCEAFQRALTASDVDIVLFVCRLVDAQQLFGTTPCILPQPVLLSLIQQLSASLAQSTDLKLDYLQEAVLVVDFKDPIIKEHGPKVMNQLIVQLQSLASTSTSGALSRQLRMLLLTAQSLQKNMA